jgi:hypothetical protein
MYLCVRLTKKWLFAIFYSGFMIFSITVLYYRISPFLTQNYHFFWKLGNYHLFFPEHLVEPNPKHARCYKHLVGHLDSHKICCKESVLMWWVLLSCDITTWCGFVRYIKNVFFGDLVAKGNADFSLFYSLMIFSITNYVLLLIFSSIGKLSFSFKNWGKLSNPFPHYRQSSEVFGWAESEAKRKFVQPNWHTGSTAHDVTIHIHGVL